MPLWKVSLSRRFLLGAVRMLIHGFVWWWVAVDASMRMARKSCVACRAIHAGRPGRARCSCCKSLDPTLHQ